MASARSVRGRQSVSRMVPRFVCSMAQPSLLTAVTAMLSVCASLSHGTTMAVTWPCAAGVLLDRAGHDSAAIRRRSNVMHFTLDHSPDERRARLAQWSNQLESRSLTPAPAACQARARRQNGLPASGRRRRRMALRPPRIRPPMPVQDGSSRSGKRASPRKSPTASACSFSTARSRRAGRCPPNARSPSGSASAADRSATRSACSRRSACSATRHGQGTFPQELDVDRLVAPLASVLSYRRDLQDELLDVRRMFEPAVARVAATRVTDEDLADLQRILDAQRKKLRTRPIGHRRGHGVSRRPRPRHAQSRRGQHHGNAERSAGGIAQAYVEAEGPSRAVHPGT